MSFTEDDRQALIGMFELFEANEPNVERKVQVIAILSSLRSATLEEVENASPNIERLVEKWTTETLEEHEVRPSDSNEIDSILASLSTPRPV